MLRTLFRAAFAVCILACAAQPACAQGDLLVAPTRLILAPASGGEVIVSNTSDKVSTYRISLVLRRMDDTGQITPIDEQTATPAEAAALEMLNYAPRKITLAPGQAQTVRIGVRAPPTLPAGEYRAHLLFRAVPDAVALPDPGATPAADGMSISLTPIYGVAIPVIVRIGAVPGEAALVSAQNDVSEGEAGLTVRIKRSGTRSVYGNIEVMTPGESKPVAGVKGIAVYPEIGERSVFVRVDPARAATAKGPLTVRFTETDPAAPAGATSIVTVGKAQ